VGSFNWSSLSYSSYHLCSCHPVISAAEKLSALYSAQSVSYSLPWIAQDAGLFRKHNLDFQLVYIPSSGGATAALLGGDVEIALAGGVGTVPAFAQGATELVFIGGFKNALTHSKNWRNRRCRMWPNESDRISYFILRTIRTGTRHGPIPYARFASVKIYRSAKETVSVRQCSEVLRLHSKGIKLGRAVQQTIQKEMAGTRDYV
jgi:hypothetical protein